MDDLQKAVRSLEDLRPVNTDWVLIDPHGRVRTGTPDALVLALMPHHSLMTPILTKDFLQRYDASLDQEESSGSGEQP